MGEKTAAKWIREYGSLDALVDQVDTVKGKVGEKLREHLSSVLQNRRLTELDRTVALELHPVDLAVRPWDRAEVHTLFDNLQFRVLRDRLFATLSSAEPEVDGGIDVTVDEVGAGGLGDWLAAHARTGHTGVVFRGSWGRGTGELTGIALAAADDHSRLRRPRPRPGRRRRAGARRLAGRPDRDQGGARGEGPAAGGLGARLGARGRGQRHRAGRLPGAAGPAVLRPRPTSPSATCGAS